VPGACGHASDRACPHGIYAAHGTERYIAIACETAEQWRALKSVAPLTDFAAPEFYDLTRRLADDNAIDVALSAWLADREPFAVVAQLKRAGVPASVVRYPSDLYEDPQLKHRN